jgi:hypothetical protein
LKSKPLPWMSVDHGVLFQLWVKGELQGKF